MKKITILLGIVLLIFMGLPAKEASAADTDYKSVVSDLFFEDSVYDENKGEYTHISQAYPVYWPKYRTIDIDAVTGKVSVEKTRYGSNLWYNPYDEKCTLGKK